LNIKFNKGVFRIIVGGNQGCCRIFQVVDGITSVRAMRTGII
jgi:hypothetical protein